jgi:hypothetical protein
LIFKRQLVAFFHFRQLSGIKASSGSRENANVLSRPFLFVRYVLILWR